MRLDLDVFGDKQFSRDLMRFEARANDMSPVFEDLADDFLRLNQEQFDSQGRNSGGWAPLAESTVRRKAARGDDPRILHATRALRNSLTNRGAAGAVREISDDEMFVGTSVTTDRGFPYPAVHQNPKQGQTRRRPVELTPRRRRDWVKTLQEYLVGQTESVW